MIAKTIAAMSSTTSDGRSASQSKQAGFTMIELVIAMFVMAILAMVALPGYQSSVMKGRRSSAVTAVAHAQQAQERFRSNSAAYAATFGELYGSTAAATFNTPDGLYSLTLSSVTATGYTITTAPLRTGRQAGDSACAAMVMRMVRGNALYSATDVQAIDSTHVCWPT